MPPRLLCVVGARPNFVKMAPVTRSLDAGGRVRSSLLHTGQHYDEQLSGWFLERLGLPEPDFFLGVGSGSHAQQTAAVLTGTEEVLQGHRFDAVLVAGDVNSTLAAALAAAKLHVPVFHLEAGLRSGDWSMPEEVNRVLTDRLSDLLLCTSEDAIENLAGEGIGGEHVAVVGNTMIDSLFRLESAASDREAAERLGLADGNFVLVTLHRPALVDDDGLLQATLSTLDSLTDRWPVVFPVHPRTRVRLESAGFEPSGIKLLEPLDYLDFVSLMRNARLVITDSGGVQEETTALGVPCLTYRETTERPITVQAGTNQVVGVDPEKLRAASEARLAEELSDSRPHIPLWDGGAGDRAAAAISQFLNRRSFASVPSPR